MSGMRIQEVGDAIRLLKQDPAYIALIEVVPRDPRVTAFWSNTNQIFMRCISHGFTGASPADAAVICKSLEELRDQSVGPLRVFRGRVETAISAMETEGGKE